MDNVGDVDKPASVNNGDNVWNVGNVSNVNDVRTVDNVDKRGDFPFVRNVLHFLVVILSLMTSANVESHWREQVASGAGGRLEGALLTCAMYLLSGVALGLDHLYRQAQRQGRWRMDGMRLLGFAAPLLVISLWVVWFYGALSFGTSFYGWIHDHLVHGKPQFIVLISLILGYGLATSLRKGA
ncbi:hypothetical protein GTO89_03070 [Heliobacterium gestii]|uniref:Uncharacterized protein n=1 Tax=Heliomicrobium gestii TaxID=2699 RepID=A0A845LGM9_HELGE|nr:hypothetical protein [Heliomicrobium gestii]MBM7865770.1 hypothetical protein [Heliomicrobium gestii]MZP42016.1 hypothetical protein [Heliomicrobium gestii]